MRGKERAMSTLTRKLGVGAIATLSTIALLGGCAADPGTDDGAAPDDGSSSQGVTFPEGEVGPAEDTEITIAIPFPDITMYSMYEVATAKGWYEEEGLTVEVITADNVAAAVSSGSADIGVESAGAVIEAIRGGVEIELLSGHYCRQNFDFATQPDIDSIEDLDGTAVVLAGTAGDPAEFQRARVLAEYGWDLDSVNVEIVYPGPDSATWREFLVNDRVSVIPFYGDDRPALEEYGANIIIESLQNWANDFHLAGSDWLAENPNSAVRFLRATMKALDLITAPGVGEVPENKDEVLDIYEAADFDVADLRVQDTPWVLDGHLACPNLYVDEEAWDITIETQSLEPLDFSENVDLGYLLKAQELLGIDNDGVTGDELNYP